MNYQHFQCSQNTNNYHESIRHQYLCTSSLIWTCISDVNDYSHNAVILLDYFCGFIDGRNALQPHTIWNIHLKPNVNIHFMKFVLFDNYWYCDYQYLRVYSNNKTTTFCGRRFPWVYDVSDTKVNIILMRQRFGTIYIELELLYYGAYIPNYQHFIIFIPSFSLKNIHYPNTEQNAFESFHFISRNRLNIMELEAVNTCSKGQVACYDGPGFKSPLLRFAYNQSVWEFLSSTFQMMCKFLRVDDVGTNGPHLYYRAIRARGHQFINFYGSKLYEHDAHSKGTTKYIYYYSDKQQGVLNIAIYSMSIFFPNMLYEGNSCMYGGLYVVQTVASKDSEILSLCTPTKKRYRYYNLNNVSVVIIHYSEYSTEKLSLTNSYNKLQFRASYNKLQFSRTFDLNQKYKGNTLSIRPIVPPRLESRGYIYSDLLELRHIQYINISFDVAFTITFEAFLRTSCMNITVFYYPRPSNIKGRQYDQETRSGYRSFTINYDFIRSIFINMCRCNRVPVPVWNIKIERGVNAEDLDNVTVSSLLPADILVLYFCHYQEDPTPSWIMCHMTKPENVPAHAIWRVFIILRRDLHWVSRVSIEALIDNHHSSSVYEWNDFRSHDGVYITVDKAVNIIFERSKTLHYAKTFDILFERQFIHDDIIIKYITGKAPQHGHFSFHNQR